MEKDQEKRIWPKVIVALVLFLALFAGGLTAGLLWKQGDRDFKKVGMSGEQCEKLVNNIVHYIEYSSNKDSEFLREMNDIYAKNCAGRVIEVKKAKSVESAQPEQKPTTTCEYIESALKARRYPMDTSSESTAHIHNAEIYANLASRGCAENAAKYRELALREIEIARALTDDKFYDNGEIIDVIETYKKLDMKAAAEQVFEKAKKLTDPAIDFILQVEKIINE
jgi:hypothetical protein